MKLYLVRHAHAGDRSRWTGDDRLRPLSTKGARQAAVICDELADEPIGALLSSPYLRCLETLQPLAERTGAPLDSDPRLAEGSVGEPAWSLMEELLARQQAAVVCSHGDVIPGILMMLRDNGIRFGHALAWPKASTWVITGNAVHWTAADYRPPPRL